MKAAPEATSETALDRGHRTARVCPRGFRHSGSAVDHARLTMRTLPGEGAIRDRRTELVLRVRERRERRRAA
jgi:hypothetical protein